MIILFQICINIRIQLVTNFIQLII